MAVEVARNLRTRENTSIRSSILVCSNLSFASRVRGAINENAGTELAANVGGFVAAAVLEGVEG